MNDKKGANGSLQCDSSSLMCRCNDLICAEIALNVVVIELEMHEIL